MLTTLNLQERSMAVLIPSDIGAIASLEVLAFAVNQLTSSIPPKRGRLAYLQKHNLQNNGEGQTIAAWHTRRVPKHQVPNLNLMCTHHDLAHAHDRPTRVQGDLCGRVTRSHLPASITPCSRQRYTSRAIAVSHEFQMSSKKVVPFNRHKENEEARKKREEDEAAHVYAEFVESFKGESTSGSKFVRGGVIDPNAKLRADSEGGKSKDGWSVPKKGSRYVPSFLPPSFGREPEKKKEDERPKEKEKGKPRAIDKFMEELKFEQELRERRNQERDGRHGDTSAGDYQDHLMMEIRKPQTYMLAISLLRWMRIFF
ncbi:hypothetical protein ACQ4PT_061654 [Festuca glaucescens]